MKITTKGSYSIIDPDRYHTTRIQCSQDVTISLFTGKFFPEKFKLKSGHLFERMAKGETKIRVIPVNNKIEYTISITDK